MESIRLLRSDASGFRPLRSASTIRGTNPVADSEGDTAVKIPGIPSKKAIAQRCRVAYKATVPSQVGKSTVEQLLERFACVRGSFRLSTYMRAWEG